MYILLFLERGGYFLSEGFTWSETLTQNWMVIIQKNVDNLE